MTNQGNWKNLQIKRSQWNARWLIQHNNSYSTTKDTAKFEFRGRCYPDNQESCNQLLMWLKDYLVGMQRECFTALFFTMKVPHIGSLKQPCNTDYALHALNRHDLCICTCFFSAKLEFDEARTGPSGSQSDPLFIMPHSVLRSKITLLSQRLSF